MEYRKLLSRHQLVYQPKRLCPKRRAELRFLKLTSRSLLWFDLLSVANAQKSETGTNDCVNWNLAIGISSVNWILLKKTGQ